MADKQPGEPTERPALVRQVNAEIRTVGEQLTEEGELPLEFYCQCGCWQTVELSIADYDLLRGEPAYRTGHKLLLT